MVKTQKPLRVLIVDDDPTTTKLAELELGVLGHDVVGLAEDGKTGIELTLSLRPDLVLMDISMPVMDGLEATRLIQERCPCPVVLLTAHEDQTWVDRASEAGAGAYLVKPPRRQDLARAIAIASARFADWMKLRQLNDELERALAEVKRLSGLLPICARCKKIRDDKGYWHKVEAYIQEHSEATFTHGICGDCVRDMYGDVIPEFRDMGNP
jgi:AmiR/NasT family two-component response regulator